MVLLAEIKREEAKEQLIQSAFIGFQMGAGGDKTFGQYLESMGLSGSKTTVKTTLTKEEILAKAERIRKAIKEKKKG